MFVGIADPGVFAAAIKEGRAEPLAGKDQAVLAAFALVFAGGTDVRHRRLPRRSSSRTVPPPSAGGISSTTGPSLVLIALYTYQLEALGVVTWNFQSACFDQ
jgi:hypothetical protein